MGVKKNYLKDFNEFIEINLEFMITKVKKRCINS